jgi:hypothetical protein
MEETPATQYIFAPVERVYHLAQSERLTLCGLWVHGEPGQQRRKDDRRLISEKPTGRFTAPCSKCDRIAKGLPERKGAPRELLSPSRLIVIVP